MPENKKPRLTAYQSGAVNYTRQVNNSKKLTELQAEINKLELQLARCEGALWGCQSC